ncbi:hypothetical protein FRC04_003725 [Tulasnella sp. 424]|nr:hypothetical protein FRC04_003725 [Tulasnella sp. 424]KAG8977055.1 hypothetical protein FRC05_002576 [Tulasnella sp. 425]
MTIKADKITGHWVSACTQQVLLVLYEKDVEFELKNIDWSTAEHKSAPHLEKQPFGQIPFIDDDGFVLFECRAICRYITAKYADRGPKLLPNSSDLRAVALFEQAASIEQSNFEPYASVIAHERYYNPLQGFPVDEAAYQRSFGILNAKLDGYERILSKQKYLAGNELTLADLWHLPYADTVEKFVPELFESHPKFNDWYQALKARPSWVKVKEFIQQSMKA